MRRVALLLFGLIILLVTESCTHTGKNEKQPSRPSIIYILADDLGYGDLSCYGQTKFNTPNIDELARQGMKFTQHYAGTSVCAPSRCALMTGLHTGHTAIRGNKEVQPEGQTPLPAETVTLAGMLQKAGYKTGAFGKWGLGFPGSEGDPMRQGFDTFFGYNCQRLAHNYYPTHLWSNKEKIILDRNEGTAKEAYAPTLIHEQALKFIEENASAPFFLYYPSVLPHAELAAPEEYIKRYRDKLLPEKSYQGVDEGEGFRTGAYGSQTEAHAAFAAMITLLDDQVGEIMKKIKELGLEENTIIIFTSDNGPHLEGGADPDYFDSNSILRGYKRDLYEGGIRVPMIVQWPNVTPAGSTTDHISAFWDVMPTIADLLDLPTGKVDGISFLPTLLTREADQQKHSHLYWEFHEDGGRQALRNGDWKLVRYNVNRDPAGAYELYNLANDPGETNDVASQFPDKVNELSVVLESEHVSSDVFPFGIASAANK